MTHATIMMTKTMLMIKLMQSITGGSRFYHEKSTP